MARFSTGATYAALGLLAAYGCTQRAERAAAQPPAQTAAGQDAGPAGESGQDAGPAADDGAQPTPPTVLASGEHGPLTLALNGDELFWATTEEDDRTGSLIRSMHAAGGAPATVLSVPMQLDLPGAIHHGAIIGSLDVDANWIFFVEQEWESVRDPDGSPSFSFAGGLYRAARSGGAAELFPIPEGFGSAGPLFSADDASLYFARSDAAGLSIAAVPKAGGVATTIRLEAPDPGFAGVRAIAMDAGHWYVAHSNHAGAVHEQCVSRAPRAGGVLADFWCPDFVPDRLLPAGGLLISDPGPWVVDLATARASPLPGTDTHVAPLAIDASHLTLYGLEPSQGSQPSTDLVRIDLTTGRRTLLDRAEEAPGVSYRRLVVGPGSIFYTRGGEILRIDR